MYAISRTFECCYGHRLIDYEGKCCHLHGHNGKIEITLESDTLDHRGMVLDFGDLKVAVERWLDAHLDHKMVLREEDPLIDLLRQAGEPIEVVPFNPTAENLAKWVFEAVAELDYPVREVKFWETRKCHARYSRPG
jgi:6-pyruvoyltetrahydropterin/6-carboxytetrahydropterin synthase